jgi:tetratricopeptide (TPR) repeat protein
MGPKWRLVLKFPVTAALIRHLASCMSSSTLNPFVCGVMLSDMKCNQLAPARILVLLLCLGLVGCVGLVERWNRAKADDLITDAGKKFAANDLKGNVQLLKDAAGIDPTNPRVWWKLCEGYQFIEELDLAIAACKQNVELHPSGGISYNSLGLAYMAKKDYSKAVEAFETAVVKSPQPALYHNYVWALQSSGQYEKAVTAAERLVEVSSDDSSEVRSSFQTLTGACLAVQQYDKAISVTQKLVELDANDPSEQTSALEYLGAIYTLTGRTKKAHEAFDKVHAVNPELTVKTCEVTGDKEKGFGMKCAFTHFPRP